jgi:hypothetical protein
MLALLARKPRWGLTWRGWLILLLLLVLAAGGLVRGVHPFLAVTARVDTQVLVMEGWLPQYAIGGVVAEFKTGAYRQIYTTGGPGVGSGGYVNDFQTMAGVGADSLKLAGVPAEVVQMVPSRVNGRDRTYSSAAALRNWLIEHRISIQRMNVLTEDAHARRTRLLYQKAFGNSVEVGIISIRNPDYDPKHWWQFSEGVREVIGESLAYLYARFLFHPTDSL